jgi:hypothetical protein
MGPVFELVSRSRAKWASALVLALVIEIDGHAW